MPRRTKQEREEVHRGQLMLDVLASPIADMETGERWFREIKDKINGIPNKNEKTTAHAR